MGGENRVGREFLQRQRRSRFRARQRQQQAGPEQRAIGGEHFGQRRIGAEQPAREVDVRPAPADVVTEVSDKRSVFRIDIRGESKQQKVRCGLAKLEARDHRS